jgi:hypothetical protein
MGRQPKLTDHQKREAIKCRLRKLAAATTMSACTIARLQECPAIVDFVRGGLIGLGF